MRIYYILLTLALTLFTACTTLTPIHYEGSSGRRIEQRAISSAIDTAFAAVDFGVVRGKTVYVETLGLSKADTNYADANYMITFINSKIIEMGGIPEKKEDSADIKIININKISGVDEIKRRIVSDIVRAQYKSTLTIIDLKTKKVVKIYTLNGEVDEMR